MKTAEQVAHSWLNDCHIYTKDFGPQEQLSAMIQTVLEAQHRETWAMAIEAAAKVVASPMTMDEFYMNQPLEYFIRAIPCPPLTPKESE